MLVLPGAWDFVSARMLARLARSSYSALNSGYPVAYLVAAGLVVVAVAVAVSTLRSRVPEAEAELAEPLVVTDAGLTVQPLSAAETAAIKGGCLETGIGITLGCGGCPPGEEKATRQAA